MTPKTINEIMDFFKGNLLKPPIILSLHFKNLDEFYDYISVLNRELMVILNTKCNGVYSYCDVEINGLRVFITGPVPNFLKEAI